MPKPDYSQIAASFMDMWQDQMTRSMGDGEFVRRMMELMRYEPQNPRHAAPASGPEPDDHDELRARLAWCERRIEALERTQKDNAEAARPARTGRAGASGADDAISPRSRPKRRAIKRAAPKKPATKASAKNKKPATTSKRGKK